MLFASLFFLFPGCAARLPIDVQRPASTAFKDFRTTTTGRLFEEAALRHPGESGFAIIRKGRPAFTTRIAMTAMAEKSLDLQYYIWEADETGRILALRLAEAADRGVKIRVLIDDNNITGRDSPIAAFDAHPNIEIRIFNPFAYRGARLFGYLTDFDRLNHRMHNKIMVVDNALAVVGGRNIGNAYFGVHTSANYRDLDIAAAGPIVREASMVFDHFWNGNWSFPIAALVDRTYTRADLEETLAAARESIRQGDFPYPLNRNVENLQRNLTRIRDDLIWAPGQVIWDDPAAVQKGEEADVIDTALIRKFQSLKKELLIESAYFVVRERGVKAAEMLHERGVRVRILTNSMASNDVLPAHAGYAENRKELVEAGVELYELRADARSTMVEGASEAKAALHTKAIVFDRESVFIGSYNLDPRSGDINTEIGLYVESPELARQVIAYMDEGVLPYNSYRVELNEAGDLVWRTLKDGEPVQYAKDPESTFWQRFQSGFIQLLPIEGQL